MMRQRVLLAVFLGALAAATPDAHAQVQDTTSIVRGRLVLIAGADLHLELSAPARLQPGDTLVVPRGASARGVLVVIAADSLRAVVHFAGAPFALTRGESMTAQLRRATAAPPQAPVTAAAQPPARRSPTQEVPRVPQAVASPARAAIRPRATGYLTTETRWIHHSSAGVGESYGIPAATLSLRVSSLPGRTTAHVFANAEHYGGTAALATGSAATRIRIYAARLESDFGNVRLGLGRLTSMHDPFGGPWDGLALTVGRQVALSAEAGWEPEQSTGAASFRFPRVSLSGQAVGGTGPLRYRGTLAALRYLDGAPADRGELALSTRHSLSAGPLTLSGDVLAESSDSSALALRWGGVHAALSRRGGARIHVAYRRYQPYAFTAIDTTIDVAARNRIEAGAYLPLGRVALSTNATVAPGASRTFGATSHLFAYGLAYDLDLDLWGGLWQRSDARTLTAGADLARSIGPLHARAAYRLERGPERAPVTAHEVEGDLALMLTQRSSIGVVAVHSTAAAARGTQLQLRLTWGF